MNKAMYITFNKAVKILKNCDAVKIYGVFSTHIIFYGNDGFDISLVNGVSYYFKKSDQKKVEICDTTMTLSAGYGNIKELTLFKAINITDMITKENSASTTISIK
jgi:hypothetical protein